MLTSNQSVSSKIVQIQAPQKPKKQTFSITEILNHEIDKKFPTKEKKIVDERIRKS